jgi:hypothetical protein
VISPLAAGHRHKVMLAGRVLICLPLKLAAWIDRQPLAPLVVQSKQHGRGLDRRRLAHRLDVAEMLHLLAADQVCGPAFQIGISRRLRPRLAEVLLDDPLAVAQGDIAFWVFEDGRLLRRASQIEVLEPGEHFGVLTVVHDDLVFEGFVFHGRIVSGGWTRRKGRMRSLRRWACAASACGGQCCRAARIKWRPSSTAVRPFYGRGGPVPQTH